MTGRRGRAKAVAAPKGGWPGQKTKSIPGALSADLGKDQKKVLAGWNPDEGASYAKRPMVWSFNHFDEEEPFSLRRASVTEFNTILTNLKSIGRMTCGDLEASKNRLYKTYSLGSIIPEAQERLRELKMDDETHVSRFEFSGKERFFGIQRSNVFYVLWWDPEHKICPSKKN